jgi:hypothetical protein
VSKPDHAEKAAELLEEMQLEQRSAEDMNQQLLHRLEALRGTSMQATGSPLHNRIDTCASPQGTEQDLAKRLDALRGDAAGRSDSRSGNKGGSRIQGRVSRETGTRDLGQGSKKPPTDCSSDAETERQSLKAIRGRFAQELVFFGIVVSVWNNLDVFTYGGY